MLVKEISYVDYNGEQQTDKFYFNMTQAELLEWLTMTGGYTLEDFLNQLKEKRNGKAIMELFKELILKSCGEKSLDGKRFIKNQEVIDNFYQTEAYSQLFLELVTDANAAAEFINGIVPKEMAPEVRKILEQAKAEQEKDAAALRVVQGIEAGDN